MEKISFNNWLETHWPAVNDPATAQTVLNKHDDTVSEPQRPAMNVQVNTDVTQTTNTLQNIQNQLTGIFKRVMEKPIWRNVQMKQAFGDRITRGWEKVGQARAIITPLADVDDKMEI